MISRGLLFLLELCAVLYLVLVTRAMHLPIGENQLRSKIAPVEYIAVLHIILCNRGIERNEDSFVQYYSLVEIY